MPLSVGDKLSHYEVSLLGQGAMGEVYQARDTRPDRTVAKKIFRKTFKDRFEREVGAVATLNQPRRLLAFSCLLMLCSSGAMAQTASNPQRWQAQYTQSYSDNIETVAPALGLGFILEDNGTLTSNPSEVVSGKASIKGAYSGSLPYNPYLRSDSSLLPLLPNHTYELSFRYKILTAPSDDFEAGFYSPTGAAAGRHSRQRVSGYRHKESLVPEGRETVPTIQIASRDGWNISKTPKRLGVFPGLLACGAGSPCG